jgi:glycine oxidase
LPQLAQVRNPRHLKALIAGCGQRGVRLVSGAPVVGFDRRNEKIVAVRTPAETYSAGQVCICSGAWSRQVLASVNCDVRVEPVRGQIVLLSMQPLPIRHVIEVGPRYLVPRPDGRILIGSTEERAGFDKRNTAGAVAELIRFGCQVVPKLADARYERAWAGLRPGSPDGRPYLGRVPGMENLFVAAGHFRAGLQLSPGTAFVMRQLLLGEEPALALDEFAVDRSESA